MSIVRMSLVLGLLAAVGPFSIDMYLPALPLIEEDLNATVAQVQATLTAYFVAFGISQLFWGPLSDQFGRKRPIYAGLGVFAVASVGAALAPTLGALVAWRAVQGIGAAVVMVTPRAIIRDLYTGPDATRLMASVMLVISVSPMLAPLAGSGLMLFGGWRLMFWVLAVATVASLILAVTALPETLPEDRRTPIRPGTLWRGVLHLMGDGGFMGLTLVGAMGFASFFVFLASASFVYTQSYGLSPVGFSLAFAFNAVGFFGASQAAASLGARFGPGRVIRGALIGFAGFTVLLLLLVSLGVDALWVVVGLLFLGNACLGLVVPTVQVLALEPHGKMAGLASSLGGTLQMVLAGAVATAAGPFFDGTALPMVAAIALCAVAALGLALVMVPKVEQAVV